MEERALSASSIKTIESCTWLYWQQYICKVPQKKEAGALRGGLVHLIFQLLLKQRHRKHYYSILKAKTVNQSPSICRLIVKILGKEKILSVDNFNLCKDMILVGLMEDFLGNGGKVGEPEFKFEISNENPKYKIKGYIDKLIFYGDKNVKIVDYKSSKYKFSGDDLSANVQSMVYSLAGYKLFKAEKVTTEFIFLRFANSPRQKLCFSQEQLKGFEEYLAYVYQIINNFDEKKAKSNMAAYNKKNNWLCGRGAWICPYIKPFTYHATLDKDGKIVKTAIDRKDLEKKGEQKCITMHYTGCPAWKNEIDGNEEGDILV